MLEAYERKHEPFGTYYPPPGIPVGPSAVYYTDFPTWVQNCWGINIVLNMDSTMGHNMISTTDPEQAIQDAGLFSEKGVMRHHAVGGWDNVNAVWSGPSKFNCDMVIFNDNVACQGHERCPRSHGGAGPVTWASTSYSWARPGGLPYHLPAGYAEHRQQIHDRRTERDTAGPHAGGL